MASLYRYKPLSQDDEIRLLQLEPGSGDDHIRFTLHPVRLSNKPLYEAISYCWGDAGETCEVFCEDGLLLVTNNLYTALRHLRREDAVRVLWADAVCINQRDIPEKNRQVRLMSRIYSQPSAVLIWLGDNSSGLDGLDGCIKTALELLPPEHVEFEEICPISCKIFLEAARLRREKKPNFLDHDWRPITSLVMRPWFNRRWIIQEVALADGAVPRTVICGDVEFPWNELASVAYRMACYGITTLLAGLSTINYHAPYMLAFLEDNGRPFYMLGAAYMTYVLAVYRKLDLVDCVTATPVFQCTDQRDHLYSLLSLHQDTLGLEADYSLSIEEVCKKFAVTALVSYQNLKLLCLAPDTSYFTGGQTQERLALPSWVPDLTRQGPVNPLVSYTIRPQLFHAGGNQKPNVTVSTGGRVLHLGGRIVDRVAKLIRPQDEVPFPTEEDVAPKSGFHSCMKMRMRNWMGACYEVAGEEYRRRTKNKGDPEQTPDETKEQTELRRGFLETLLCGMTTMREPVPEEVLLAMQVYVDYLFDYFTDGFELSEEVRITMLTWGAVIENSLLGMVDCRRFCRTEQGRLGQVRNEASEGDAVVCIVGAEVPYLLRENTEKKGVYTLVGDCFLQGVMQGEAFSDQRYQTVDIAIE
ncbi:HET-domain-containing protein [Parathielavia hyrcaniae]|uniref:HET-domain-containing protein n=1 Tax=Parathielavia hyrcaniae TaxID=113614 RepID=A0AAN6T0C2_9PEZI|nr:HET-domain-containing protein [Parathielavia hyrcaniae]